MIEALITKLVQDAPVLDGETITQLVELLRRDGRPLAKAIARVVDLVGEQLVDAGAALPALAMACTTLCDVRLGEPEREAARFEIETLLPVPSYTGERPRFVIADVPVDALKKRRN